MRILTPVAASLLASTRHTSDTGQNRQLMYQQNLYAGIQYADQGDGQLDPYVQVRHRPAEGQLDPYVQVRHRPAEGQPDQYVQVGRREAENQPNPYEHAPPQQPAQEYGLNLPEEDSIPSEDEFPPEEEYNTMHQPQSVASNQYISNQPYWSPSVASNSWAAQEQAAAMPSISFGGSPFGTFLSPADLAKAEKKRREKKARKQAQAALNQVGGQASNHQAISSDLQTGLDRLSISSSSQGRRSQLQRPFEQNIAPNVSSQLAPLSFLSQGARPRVTTSSQRESFTESALPTNEQLAAQKKSAKKKKSVKSTISPLLPKVETASPQSSAYLSPAQQVSQQVSRYVNENYSVAGSTVALQGTPSSSMGSIATETPISRGKLKEKMEAQEGQPHRDYNQPGHDYYADS